MAVASSQGQVVGEDLEGEPEARRTPPRPGRGRRSRRRAARRAGTAPSRRGRRRSWRPGSSAGARGEPGARWSGPHRPRPGAGRSGNAGRALAVPVTGPMDGASSDASSAEAGAASKCSTAARRAPSPRRRRVRSSTRSESRCPAMARRSPGGATSPVTVPTASRSRRPPWSPPAARRPWPPARRSGCRRGRRRRSPPG